MVLVVVLVVVVVAEVMRSTCHPVTAATTATQGLLRGVYGFVKAEGISGIYRGLFATVCKSASNQALRFVIFGEYKRLMWGSRPAHEMPPYVALGGGMVAGAMGSVITMPFDVLKTKMQGMRADRRTLHSTRTAHAQHTHSTCTAHAHAWCVHGVCMVHALRSSGHHSYPLPTPDQIHEHISLPEDHSQRGGRLGLV